MHVFQINDEHWNVPIGLKDNEVFATYDAAEAYYLNHSEIDADTFTIVEHHILEFENVKILF